MAARLNPAHDQRTREKIQTSQLINRLVSHAKGEAEMSATQVRAAEILLKKALPDLQSVQLSGTDADGNPSEILIRVIKPDR
jgi:hypothetical protein